MKTTQPHSLLRTASINIQIANTKKTQVTGERSQ
jgi:hypothetical protein